MGRGNSGALTKVEVPLVVDRETVGWRTVSEPVELQREVVERNRTNLNQAKSTPFRSGPGFELLHGKDRWKQVEDITEGRTEFKYGMKEVDYCVKNLQRCYDADILQQEVTLINNPITT